MKERGRGGIMRRAGADPEGEQPPTKQQTLKRRNNCNGIEKGVTMFWPAHLHSLELAWIRMHRPKGGAVVGICPLFRPLWIFCSVWWEHFWFLGFTSVLSGLTRRRPDATCGNVLPLTSDHPFPTLYSCSALKLDWFNQQQQHPTVIPTPAPALRHFFLPTDKLSVCRQNGLSSCEKPGSGGWKGQISDMIWETGLYRDQAVAIF